MTDARFVKVCPGCGNEDALHKRDCEKCGRQYRSKEIIEEGEKKNNEQTVCLVKKAIDEKFCSECGSVIKAKAEICPKCGVRQIEYLSSLNSSSVAGNRSRIVAAVFALFLGFVGAHKFYLGQIGWGVAYLILCLTGILVWVPAIIAFVEFILFLVMSDEEFNRKYNRNA